MPCIYALLTLTHKGRLLIGANKREHKIRLEQITHDITVLDAVIFFREKYKLKLSDTESERKLHIKDDFGQRKHQPDFIFTHERKSYAVEVELTPKSKANFEKNVQNNYLAYDTQIWLTDDKKVLAMLQNLLFSYSNIEIISLEEISCPHLK